MSSRPRWGAPEVVFGLLAGTFLSSLIGVLVVSAGGWEPGERTGDGAAVGRSVMQYVTGQEIGSHQPPLVVTALLVTPLWIGLLGGVYVALRRGATPSDLRLAARPSDAWGFLVGVAVQLVAVPMLYLPLRLVDDDLDVSEAARSLVDRAHGIGVVVLFLVVVLGAPIVEEVFYRGLFLSALERAMSPLAALALSSVVFGAVHLQPLQFPALVMFGAVAALLVQRTGRLGPAVAAHVGFNMTTVVVLLASR